MPAGSSVLCNTHCSWPPLGSSLTHKAHWGKETITRQPNPTAPSFLAITLPPALFLKESFHPQSPRLSPCSSGLSRRKQMGCHRLLP